MPLLTFIVRLNDGLALCSSAGDENDETLEHYKKQWKVIVKELSTHSPPRCSIETNGSFVYHYLIQEAVVYLTLTDRSYPKKLAFSYLEELQKEFDNLYHTEIEKATRPYAFIKFDVFMQKTKKLYMDTRNQRNLSKLNDNLNDVQRIMTKNIHELLGRKDQLDVLYSM